MTTPPKVKNSEEKLFQHYTSSRVAMNLVTHKGRKIVFSNHEFITDDEIFCKYLDDEIKLGLNTITKGKKLSAADADPMEVLRRKHISEFLASEAARKADEANGITRDMGNTKQAAVNPASSKAVPK